MHHRFSLLKKLLLPIFLLNAELAFSFGAPKHSKLEKQIQDSNIVLKVVPEKGMQLTYDAPWSLKLKNQTNVTFEKLRLGKDDLDQKNGAFKFTASQTNQKWDADYELTAFICTKDKTRCYRETHKGSFKNKPKEI